MNLLIEYFKSPNPSRDQEYIFCIKQNISNPLIEKIHVFISDESILDEKSDKLNIVKLDNRPTFYDLMEYCNLNLEGQKCIISNTDIFFDQTLSHLENFNFDNKFISLTRWDIFQQNSEWFVRFYHSPWKSQTNFGGTIDSNQVIYTSEFSQDSWIFSTPIKLDVRTKFLMGKPGCDNRISQVLFESGYEISNPSKLIKSYHYHQTNYRTYNHSDVVPGPYLLIESTDKVTSPTKVKTIPCF